MLRYLAKFTCLLNRQMLERCMHPSKCFEMFITRFGQSLWISLHRSLPPIIDKTVGFSCDPNLIKYKKSWWLFNHKQHTGRKITFKSLTKQILFQMKAMYTVLWGYCTHMILNVEHDFVSCGNSSHTWMLVGLSLERPYLMQGQKLMYQESDHNPL